MADVRYQQTEQKKRERYQQHRFGHNYYKKSRNCAERKEYHYEEVNKSFMLKIPRFFFMYLHKSGKISVRVGHCLIEKRKVFKKIFFHFG